MQPRRPRENGEQHCVPAIGMLASCALAFCLALAGLGCVKDPQRPELHPGFSHSPEQGTDSTYYTFEAVNVGADTPGSVSEVRWDWHNDGTWDTSFTTDKHATHRFLRAGTWPVRMQARILGDITGEGTRDVVVLPYGWGELPGTGVDDEIHAMIEFKGSLIVGGWFSAPAEHIASFDGTTWTGMGGGLNLFVNALLIHDGDLIVGGSFTTAGGSPANRIARWNGASWDSLGHGLDGEVSALCTYNGNLYAAGNFHHSGPDSVVGIARWNGASWEDVGFTEAGVKTMIEFDHKLVVGGDFSTIGAVPAASIASWDGERWTALGSGIDGWVQALAVYQDALVVGGWFTDPAANIAVWGGSTWTPLGDGITPDENTADSGVMCLAAFHGDLIVGGGILMAGETPAANVARWSASTQKWSALGHGLTYPDELDSDDVYALAVHQDMLIAGGYFTKAGDTNVPYVARWIE